MDPATEAAIVASVTALAQLEPQLQSLVVAWVQAPGDEEKQVALARIAANVSVDAYQKIADAVGK